MWGTAAWTLKRPAMPGLAGCGVLWGFRTGDELCGAGASYLVRSPEDIRVLVLDA